MPFVKTFIPGLLIYEPKVILDSRGYFFESYNEKTFLEEGIKTKFVQDNQSQSSFGVLRGLHFQIPPFAQTKLLRVVSGTILDIALDIRKGSPTFGNWFGIQLSAENKRQLLIPQGFAHGFSVLSEMAEVFYKCDNFYYKQHDRGILPIDPKLKIDWQLNSSQIILSDRDKNLPLFENCDIPFVYTPKT